MAIWWSPMRESKPAADIDPGTLAVLRGRLDHVADEMCVLQVRSSFSPVISEMRDMANGIYEYASGDTIVQGHTGQPIFVTTVQAGLASLRRQFIALRDRPEPGDVFVFNDPFEGGTHLPDVTLASPVYWSTRPLGWLASTGHWADVGAATAGSFAPNVTEIFEEGLRLPPLRLMRRGRKEQGILNMLLANTRLPDSQAGDIEAQLNALAVGADRLREVVETYGESRFRRYIVEMRRRAEDQMRSHIAELPDGVYEALDYLDNDGITDVSLPISLKLTVAGDAAHLDFRGSAAQTDGPVNASQATTIAACQVAFKHLFPDVPINAGCFVPFTYMIPQRSIVGALPPHAVGGYSDVAHRVVDVIMQAVAHAKREIAFAGSFGTPGVTAISGRDNQDRYFVATLPYAGGYGGCADRDGLVHGTSLIGSANFPSLEATEREWPISWLQFAIREDSAGPGEFRGGCGTHMELELRRPTIVTILGDRGKFPPRGILGGGPGALNRVELDVGGTVTTPPLRTRGGPWHLPSGARIRLFSPGGGGYGPATSRPLAAIALDVRAGVVSVAAARKDYGVRVHPKTFTVKRAGNSGPQRRDQRRVRRPKEA